MLLNDIVYTYMWKLASAILSNYTYVVVSITHEEPKNLQYNYNLNIFMFSS